VFDCPLFVFLQVVEQGLQGVAVFQVAYSLSAGAGCDRVLVMEGGRVVEGGPPQELLAQHGSRFAALYRAGHTVLSGMGLQVNL
jgi:ABC-type multidrug transport system fused ATPase/permease subunit